MSDLRRIRVLLVDDDPIVCAGLELMLSSADDVQLVGRADDGDQALEAIRTHRPDVVLMDVRMQRQDGVTTTGQIKRLDNPPRVVVLTTFDADDVVVRAITAGADGFLLKTSSPTQILDAVRGVDGGQATLSPATVRAVFAHVASSDDPQRTAARTAVTRLTDREREVSVAVARGLSNAQIARELYASEATVKTHLASAQHKLGVTNRVSVAVVVTKAGLV
ncbi:DNA-binding NarL/FixJ family response regulator [Barrientosiimonas humi]|uniref:DNA-binding NarL/FixJ family response regulator n=1 Tax=Barrientosiimonas humi TaxID=999931 RepID=A0A542XGH5_9MICO|nr:response regulator transcription factor [Barrientosiimonas humi]TQL34920.1 DNA-binding NarL/FixJ family response regulator [Barrientosiimonas humi]